MAAPSAPATLPGPPQPSAADAVTGMQSAQTEYQTQQDAINKARDAEEAPLRADVQAGLADLQTSAAKPVERVPLPQNMAKHLDPKQMNEAASVFMTLGALAGLMTRQPMTAALGNMTAAMKGVQAGDAEQYDTAMNEFKVNFDKAMKTNDAMLKEREDILKDKRMSLTAKMQAWDLVSAKYGDQATRAEKSFQGKMKLYDGMLRATKSAEDVGLRVARLEETIRHDREIEATRRASAPGGTSGGIPQQTVDFYARQSLSGDNSWQVGLARGKVGQALIAAVKDRIPAMASESGMSPQEASLMKNKRDAIASAMKQRQQFLSTAQQFIRQFKTQADLVEKYLEPGVGGSIPAFNKWIQIGRKGTGDPDVVAFDTAIRGLAREHQRIVTGVTSNAQLHVSAQNTADELANRSMTADQVRSTLKVMREEADNAIDAGKAEIDFNAEQLKHLGPQTTAAPAGGKSPPGVQTATNPKTGEKIMLKDGKWVPLQ